jgi:hypothetical protein
MDIDGAIDRFRSPLLAGLYGEAMVSVLEHCRDLLAPLNVRWNTASHGVLVLSKPGDPRAIRVHIDSTMVDFALHENWEDGAFLRTREERIRCAIGDARAALVELLNRLGPAKA